MKLLKHRRRYNRRRQSGPVRYMLAGMAGAVCILAAVALCVHLGVPAAHGVEAVPPSPSPASQSDTASDTYPNISVGSTPTPSPEPVDPADTWQLRLVNKDNPLPRDFTVELTEVEGCQFDARAADALSQMLSDMEEKGLSPLVCSSFRTWEDQEALHQNKVDRLLAQGYSQEEAQVEAARWVVPAGTSEHELGLAADIVASSYQILEEEQENTPEQQWLMAHCQEYGFILRYPQDKADITGVGYEPWHYRYVGVEAATEIMEQGLCLEEYLGQAAS